jgi:hypothetical protein
MKCQVCGTMCKEDHRTICDSCLLGNQALIRAWTRMKFFKFWLGGFSFLSIAIAISLIYYAYLYITRGDFGCCFLFVINYFGFWAFVKCAKDSWFEYQKYHDDYFVGLLEA